MSNLDSIVATLDEGLIPGLNFSLSNHQAARVCSRTQLLHVLSQRQQRLQPEHWTKSD